MSFFDLRLSLTVATPPPAWTSPPELDHRLLRSRPTPISPSIEQHHPSTTSILTLPPAALSSPALCCCVCVFCVCAPYRPRPPSAARRTVAFPPTLFLVSLRGVARACPNSLSAEGFLSSTVLRAPPCASVRRPRRSRPSLPAAGVFPGPPVPAAAY
mmetsp:Transcript_2025/g.6141  ORF Transcript_2025/g.6141 Transcript_2025/m.6141 type:complete len:157 (-) Transcript_2025:24-494(-)